MSVVSGNLHGSVIDTLGSRIVDGELAPGATVLADDVAREFGVGRSVVREALRVLESLGLIAPTRRIGTRVLPPSRWNVYDPRVIAWRLNGTDEAKQLRWLTELRLAVEPLAAELAARHATAEAGGELLETAARMRTLGKQGKLEEFLELDILFHRGVLEASGNEMFRHLHASIAEVLRGRTHHGLMPPHPHDEALQWHVDVADAIHAGDPVRARAAMEGIMRRAYKEMEGVWRE